MVDKGRHAFIAIGFRERSDAFDLKALLEDLVAYNQRVELANTRTQHMDHLVEEQQRQRRESIVSENGGGDTEAAEQEETLSPALLNLKLKEGEKLKLDLTHALDRGGHQEGGEKKRGPSPASASASPVLLPPPPAAKKQAATVVSSSSPPPPPPPASVGEGEEEEWGGFVG